MPKENEHFHTLKHNRQSTTEKPELINIDETTSVKFLDDQLLLKDYQV